jgi:aspartyl-tRNA(Asn)/glutamyl-tRNA(Gln) amidotransferase subunit B
MEMEPILTIDDIKFLISDRYISDYFDEVRKFNVDPKITFNLIKNDVMGVLKEKGIEMKDFTISPKHLAELVLLIFTERVTSKTKKIIFEEMVNKNVSPFDVIKEKKLEIIKDENQIRSLIQHVISKNQPSVNDYRNGKEKAFKHLLGSVMKETNGLVDTKKANDIMIEELKKD